MTGRARRPRPAPAHLAHDRRRPGSPTDRGDRRRPAAAGAVHVAAPGGGPQHRRRPRAGPPSGVRRRPAGVRVHRQSRRLTCQRDGNPSFHRSARRRCSRSATAVLFHVEGRRGTRWSRRAGPCSNAPGSPLRRTRGGDGCMDSATLVVLSDFMPGALGEKVGGTGRPQREWFAPSVDLTRAPARDCRSEWVLAHNTARHAGDGYASADMALWDCGDDGGRDAAPGRPRDPGVLRHLPRLSTRSMTRATPSSSFDAVTSSAAAIRTGCAFATATPESRPADQLQVVGHVTERHDLVPRSMPTSSQQPLDGGRLVRPRGARSRGTTRRSSA